MSRRWRAGADAHVRLLAFSDLHTDVAQAKRLARLSEDADVAVGVGDFASVHAGLEETIEALRTIRRPAVLVPGNNETADALRDACQGWESAVVLHGEGTEIDGVAFFGLGAGVPVTPWDWSFDLTEEEAARMLERLPGRLCARRSLAPPRAPGSEPLRRHLAARPYCARSRASARSWRSAGTFTSNGDGSRRSARPAS